MALGTVLLGSALLGTAGSVIAGNKAAGAAERGANQAADAQLQAVRESNALQLQMFNQAMAQQAPWIAAGKQALGNLQGFMGMTPTASGPSGVANPPTGTNAAPVYGGAPTPVSGAPGGAMQGGPSGGSNIQQDAMPWMSQGLTNIDFTQPGSIRVSGEANMPWTMRTSQMEDGGRAGEPGAAMASPTAPIQNQTTQPMPGAPQSVPAPQNGQPAPQNGDPFQQFLNSTNYQFTADQGNNALSRLLARTGHLGSGRGQMAAIDYNQNMAHANAIGPYMNQLNTMAGLGQNASMQGGQWGMNLGNMMGGNIMQGGLAAGNAALNAGNARSSSYQNTGNALSNMFTQFGTYYGMRPLFQSTVPGKP